MTISGHYSEYPYRSAEASCAAAHLWPAVLRQCRLFTRNQKHTRILDLGCGNGALAGSLAAEGHEVVGVDLSTSGIEQASRFFPRIQFHVASVYDDLRSLLGVFDIVVSLEVVEHLYSPKTYAKNAFDVLRPGGYLLLSTPYHGYLKNLALALVNGMDAHYGALWESGHIKFWSPTTITRLLTEAGFQILSVIGAGRVPLLWKSMIVSARKPM